MGVLDDAIRQHLELKRQHGAPEDELQRQEEEALGPARRDVAPAEATDGDGEVELEAAEDLEEAPADAPDEAAAEEPTPGEAALEAHEETVLQEPEGFLYEPEDEPESVAESDAQPEPEPSTPYDSAADASVGFDEESEEDVAEEDVLDEGDEPRASDADVLEDTPDFLQETPEHDRLWFEQKPPRDFDFD